MLAKLESSFGMSGHGDKGAWGELVAGPSLDVAVRAALAERIVRWVTIPLWLLTLSSGVAVLATLGLSSPTRLVPNVVTVLALLVLQRYTRKQRFVGAAATLSALMFVAIASGVLLNGVHAPVYSAGLVLLGLV